MGWYYALNGKQEGPVSESQIQDLIRTGALTPETLVWRQGMTGWQPWRVGQATAGPNAVAAPADTVVCVECGKSFPQDMAVSYQGAWVCAGRKPIFLQRIQEGLKPTGMRVFRSGKDLVMDSGSALPDRCVKCNAPSQGKRLHRKLYWHHPAVYLVILINLLIYLLVALIVRKKAEVDIGVCERHLVKRKRDIAVSWLLGLGGLGLIVGAFYFSNGWAGVAGTLALLLGLIYASITVPLVGARKIDQNQVWLRGCCREYLDSFPEWKG